MNSLRGEAKTSEGKASKKSGSRETTMTRVVSVESKRREQSKESHWIWIWNGRA